MTMAAMEASGLIINSINVFERNCEILKKGVGKETPEIDGLNH